MTPVRACTPAGAAGPEPGEVLGRPALTPTERDGLRRLISDELQRRIADEKAAHQAKVFAADPRKRP